jgi:hypothetical protein
MARITEAVADTGPTFKNMRTLAKKTSEQLEAFARFAERFDPFQPPSFW